tara:strand:+ start:365 stop:2389 length:2025 start_codon:yes stop_codon:yes gene_type:complete
MTYLNDVHGIIIGGINLSIEIECAYQNNKFKTYNILEEDRERKVSLRRAAGAHKVASYLREFGADVEVVDYAFMWTFEELKDLWKSRYYSKTLFFGVSTSFHQASGHLWQFVEWLREKYPHIAIIGGTQSIDKLLGFYCDYYIFGYGEVAAFELIKNLKDGTTSNIKYHDIEGKKVINAQINYKAFPKKDLSVSYEDRDFIKPHEVLDIEFSRGCIFQCAFCSFPILGVRDDHSRCEHNLYTELLENYEKWGTTRYNISDETANDYHKKLERYASVVRKLPFKPDMQGYARGDILVATERNWETYLDLGFMGHFYGVESLYQPAAKAIGKGMDSERLKDGLLKFKEWAYKNNDGFYVAFMSLIAGLPNETYDTLTDQVEWLRKNWRDQFSVFGILQMHLPNNTSKYKEVAKDLGNISLIEKNPESYGYKILGPSKYEKLHSKVFKAENWTQLTDDGSQKGERGFSVGGDLSEQQGKPIWNRFSQPAQTTIDNTTGLERQYNPVNPKTTLDQYPAYGLMTVKEPEIVKDLFPAKEQRLNKKDDPKYKAGHFKQHNSWVSNEGLTVDGINDWMRETANKYKIHDMPTITQGSIASWNQLEYYVDPSVEKKDMVGKGKNAYKVNAATLTQTINGSTSGVNTTQGGIQFTSATDRGANELYYHKKKFLQAYKRNKLNA